MAACREWPRYRDPDGYGVITFHVRGSKKNRKVKVHRLSWMATNRRPIPRGHVVMHSCDNPPCYEPTHLYLGTTAANNADMVGKGRQARGASNGRAHLTEAEVMEIRRRFAQGETQVSLADEYSVWQATISSIVLRKTWGHL